MFLSINGKSDKNDILLFGIVGNFFILGNICVVLPGEQRGGTHSSTYNGKTPSKMLGATQMRYEQTLLDVCAEARQYAVDGFPLVNVILFDADVVGGIVHEFFDVLLVLGAILEVVEVVEEIVVIVFVVLR